jgi:hypothetical protein
VVVVRHAGVGSHRYGYRLDFGRNATGRHKKTKYRGPLLVLNRGALGPFDVDRASTGVTSLEDIFEVD